MSRRLFLLDMLAAFLLAACGGSSNHTTSSGTTLASTPSQTATSAPTGTTSSTLTATMATTSAGPAPGTPGSTGSAPAPGQEKIRLPANFTIRAGGKLAPSSLSAPAFLAISLSVASSDGKAHHVLVRTPLPHALSVRAGARAFTLIPGLRPGHYAITVDGTVTGSLDIGGEPGP